MTPTHTSSTATQRTPPQFNNLLVAPLQHLREAVQDAEMYLQQTDTPPEVLNIHINFVSQRIAAVDRAVQSINRRNKNEECVLPDEAERANTLIKRLQIEKVIRTRQEKTTLNNTTPRPSENLQVVIKKPPLPPLQIPRFSGDTLEYHNFITIFDETVHKNEALVPSQKLAYLQSYVDGEAKKLIGKILVTDQNYDIARDALKLNYGQTAHSITVLYDRLHDVAPAKNDPFSIRDTYNEIESILQMIEHAGVQVNADTYLFHEVMKKWPWSLIRQIVRTIDMNMEQFRQEMAKEVKLQIQLTQTVGYTPYSSTASQIQRKTTTSRPIRTSNASQHNNNEATPTSLDYVAPATQRTAHCVFCHENHYSEHCTKYTTANQRIQRILDRCKKCFRKLHEGEPCIRNMKCMYCPSYDHNRAICPVKYGEIDQITMFTSTTESATDTPGLFVTLCTIVANPKTQNAINVRILMDLASNRTVMTERVAQAIGVQIQTKNKSTAKGMGGKEIEPITEESVEIAITVRDDQPITVPVRLTEKIARDVPVYDVQQFRRQYPQCEKYYIPPTGKGRPIDIILGSDTMLRFLTLQSSVFIHQTCQLLSTKFGWLIMAEPDHSTLFPPTALFTLSTTDDEIIKTMCDLDIVGMKNLTEPQIELEERALRSFYESVKYLNGRYEVHWPWKTYPPILNENYGLAYGRLRSLFKQLLQKPQLLDAYNQIIQEQLKEGVVEDVPKNKEEWGKVIHYIPHHAVVTLEKSTPVRIVYDGSATTTMKRSLNDNILKGTKWLGNMIESLLRFSKNKTAVSADIRRAFHQIAIAPEDRDAVRFLWVHDCSKPPQPPNIRFMRFKRVAFGIVASPFLLYATIQYHLQHNPTKYTHILSAEMYADNLLTSLPQSVDHVEFYETAKNLFSSMSMNLTKWKTNALALNERIPKQDKIEETTITVLGLIWDAQTDKLYLKQPKLEKILTATSTKRIILKSMASIFDPLGWVAPFVLLMRILLRKLWRERLTWDEHLPAEIVETWNEIKSEIKSIQNVCRDRMYFPIELDSYDAPIQIHTFVDASAEAIGNVSYLRLVHKNNTYISFVFAKSKLSPNTKLTIPRLELYGMTIGARIQQYVINALNLKHKPYTYIWSDSKCVLSWVASPKLLPSAVENYLSEIRNRNIYRLNYVPTAMNPADVASRGVMLSSLLASSWLTGPSWLVSEDTWPKQSEQYTYDDTQTEQLDTSNETYFIQDKDTLLIEPPFSLNPDDFSHWKALLRRTAYCIWLLNTILQKQIIKVRTPIDYAKARLIWIRWDQRRNHAQNIQKVKQMKHMKNVIPFTDEDNIMRCTTRLTNTALPNQTTQPIILVKGSRITQLIILDIHERNFHVGTAHTLATLRKYYWLPQGRREVYHVIHTSCYKCKRYQVKPFVPAITPPFPPYRVKPTQQPFQNTGIDVFGPIYIYTTETQNKQKAKRWILLFTCLVIRAIHLEIITAMDTIDILCAIKRFISRRGTPACILSDNAPQFHLIQGCLVQLWTHFIQDEQTNKYFAENEIDWKFIPQSAPWMGGAYERMVQVTKNAFKRTYGEQTLTEREFNTTIVEIEGVINNRPITYVDRELGTPLLTPNHFLRVSYPAIPINDNSQQTNPPVTTRENLLQYWKASENHMNIYWRCWSEQYLTALRDIHARNSINQRKLPVIGDIVLMVDPSQRRGYWRTAQIERLIPSADGVCRSAQIRVANGNRLIRPLVKLASLELLENLPHDQRAEVRQNHPSSSEDLITIEPASHSSLVVIAPLPAAS